jgi:hypothetical protein
MKDSRKRQRYGLGLQGLLRTQGLKHDAQIGPSQTEFYFNQNLGHMLQECKLDPPFSNRTLTKTHDRTDELFSISCK